MDETKTKYANLSLRRIHCDHFSNGYLFQKDIIQLCPLFMRLLAR